MVDSTTKLALCPECGSPDLVAVTLAFHAITDDHGAKGVFEHQDWGDDYHLECSACDWNDGQWSLVDVIPQTPTACASLNDLTYATYDEAKELAKIREEFRKEKGGTAP